MASFLRRFIFVLLFVMVAGHGRHATASTLSYLQSVSDKCQRTVDVYTDADAACNHFAERGEFDTLQADLVTAMDEISSSAQCFGITCITAIFDPRLVQWGGWYFLNGVLGPTARQPSPNWGDQPNAGYDLNGAAMLQFWAKGAGGGEVVHFFAFGVGNTAAPFQLYPDSSDKVELPNGAATLSATWTQYQIPLAGLDVHYLLGGFGWVAGASERASISGPIMFYLDNTQYLKARPSDSRFLVSYATIKSTNSFAPESGLTGGGTQVSILGNNSESGARVPFGNANAVVFQVSPSQIQATTPPGIGTVSITVVNPDGQSSVLANAFTYQTPTTTNPVIQATTEARTVSGTVTGVNPNSAFAVVVYAFTNQYCVQACDLDPPASINSDGTLGPVQSHNGAISAILVRQGYVSASTLQSHPVPDGVNVFAISNVAGTLTGCDVARCPTQ